jgi:hypothetical protein
MGRTICILHDDTQIDISEIKTSLYYPDSKYVLNDKHVRWIDDRISIFEIRDRLQSKQPLKGLDPNTKGYKKVEYFDEKTKKTKTEFMRKDELLDQLNNGQVK